MSTTTHREASALLGAFALDALDPEEAEAVELHIRECPRCRAEVESFREAASMLAFQGGDPPPGVWDRIVSSLEEAPPKLELARVVPLPAPAWKSRLTRATAVAAVVLSVLALAVAITGNRRNEDPVDQHLAAMVRDPDMKRITLAAPNGDAKAEVLLLHGRGWVTSHSLPELSEDQTYQLWGVSGTTAVSLGTLDDLDEPAPFSAAVDYDALAITAEQKPGVVASDQVPVVVGAVQKS